MEIKTRARLDIEGIKISADNMTPEEYTLYCNKKWLAVESLKEFIEKELNSEENKSKYHLAFFIGLNKIKMAVTNSQNKLKIKD